MLLLVLLLLLLLLFGWTEIGKVRGNLFQINGNEKKPMVLPEPIGPVVNLSEKVYVPVKEFPDVSDSLSLSLSLCLSICLCLCVLCVHQEGLVSSGVRPRWSLRVAFIWLLIGCWFSFFTRTDRELFK